MANAARQEEREQQVSSTHQRDLVARDRAHLWHPYTQMQTAPAPLAIARGQGVYLYTEDGRRLLDGISSWWVNIHGHSHPRLNEALAAQGARAGARRVRRLYASPGGGTGGAVGCAVALGFDAHLLLRQRLDRGRGRLEDGLPVLAKSRWKPDAAASLHSARPTTATQ